jgi:glycosyltransferase involved in cell wall biosynthesis
MEYRSRISVLLPVYNAQATLGAAIDSILAQTLGSFELIVLDDGSTDGSRQVLKEYQHRDARLKICSCAHLGIIAALNKGLELAEGEFIARMDADDISLPRRFEIQAAYLTQHPEVGACGSWAQRFGAGHGLIRGLIDPADIQAELLFQSPVIHPTAMLRAELFRKHHLHYEFADIHAEDHGLWLRLSRHAALSNLPEVLLQYRIRPNAFSSRLQNDPHFWPERYQSKISIYRAALKPLGLNPGKQELDLHFTICHPMAARSPDFLAEAEAWLMKLASANQGTQTIPIKALNRAVGRAWYNACYATSDRGWQTWRTFHRSPARRYIRPGLKQILALAAKCVLGKSTPRIPLP